MAFPWNGCPLEDLIDAACSKPRRAVLGTNLGTNILSLS
jgi:hypothetical protein